MYVKAKHFAFKKANEKQAIYAASSHATGATGKKIKLAHSQQP